MQTNEFKSKFNRSITSYTAHKMLKTSDLIDYSYKTIYNCNKY